MSRSISPADPANHEEGLAAEIFPTDPPKHEELLAADISWADAPKHEELLATDIFWDDPLQFDKTTLTNSKGVSFRKFRSTLTPRYGVVWRNIALGYLALGSIGAGLILTQILQPNLVFPAIAIAAPLFGYAMQYLMLFFHEAAHYNIAPNRRWNDRLANALICCWIGMEIKRYRAVHFDHHRFLGTPRDTEISYFSPLSMRTLIEAATGLRILRYLMQPKPRCHHQAPSSKQSLPSGRRQLVIGMILNALILGVSFWSGAWPLALAWLIGLGIFAPLFQVIRQTLEHRRESADPLVDYRTTPHGEVNRLFGDGPIASSFGGAGFNRHLLHHWDPQLSYTQLGELERFLLEFDLPVATYLRSRQTTYMKTFRNLFRWR